MHPHAAKDDTLADLSDLNTQHSVWIMAQVLPWEAVIMSKIILFWGQLFSLETLVFSEDRLCHLRLVG